MRHQPIAATVLATLLLAPGSAQSVADLLQKGIHTQETEGDLDAAIQIFRQVASSASSNKLYAAQAQYQLVVCMVQKGDRAGADKEFQLLARNFPEHQDLVSKGRKLLPGGALLAAPWGNTESIQLDIKRDGVRTGEYLFYSVDPPATPLQTQPPQLVNPQAVAVTWELKTRNSSRSISLEVDRDTMRPLGKPRLESDDDLGDSSAAPFAGPAIDVEESVFLMRRLPLALGYKTTLTTRPFTLGHGVPRQVELTVTGIEAVQTPAGKYNCYKVSVAAIGQTFWIGIDGSRPLVKFQSGSVEADLVKVWGAIDLESVLAFLPAAGWKVTGGMSPGGSGAANAEFSDDPWGLVFIDVWMRKIHTPAAEIAEALRQAMDDEIQKDSNSRYWTDFKVRPESIQIRLIGGQQALSCLADVSQNEPNQPKTDYFVWIRTENAAMRFHIGMPKFRVAALRWQFDLVLAPLRIP
jgi:hypothetical protein